MEKNAIILFVRNPVLGKVKTRLAATIGKEYALDIYKKLLDRTRSISSEIDCDKYVFYSDEVNDQDIWDNNIYQKRIQKGADLGERMDYAFNMLFNSGYENILIIGSDCYELSKAHLEEAFGLLREVDVVIGPAEDGGYYLLGLKAPAPELFTEMIWSSTEVFDETIIRLDYLKRRYLLLPMRNDIDEERDLPKGWR